MKTEGDTRPNIVLILADDMGFSDIGCYGSEIRTTNLDRLARNGLRFSQMYNTARCCPSRASLLTGLSPHQAGVGHMVADLGVPQYQGYLSENCVTIAEALKESGYATAMSGKWHIGGTYNVLDPSSWRPGDDRHPIPTQRGFDRFFGIVTGAANFFNPKILMRDEEIIDVESTDFYFTDAITDNAVQMIEESSGTGKPFFLHVAYTAPHWPLQAWEEDIARYEGKYRDGWNTLRTNRHEELKGKRILDSKWDISPRHSDVPDWEDVRLPDWEDLRMSVYAAQIDRMDQGVGKIMDKLKQMDLEDNTLVMFLSDNGGCAEFMAEDSMMPNPSQYSTPTADGRDVTVGNLPGLRPGPDDTYMSYDLPWANASNTPFRLFKHWVHEGGISTPFVVRWPDKIKESGIIHEPAQFTDIMATCLNAAQATYPKEYRGKEIIPTVGQSLVPLMVGSDWSREQPLFWEHEGNRAVRLGQWKLVSEIGSDWELYDMESDRTELKNLAEKNRTRVDEMVKLYAEWAQRCGVQPWPLPGWTWSPTLIGTHAHTGGRNISLPI